MSTIQILEKPDWVTWEEIKTCLLDAHASNRESGIDMNHYHWPAEKIKESLGDNGIMLVALDGKRVVGTAAVADKEGNAWYVKSKYAYLCFAGVLPSYRGSGIYKDLTKRREEYAQKKHYEVLLLDTHSRNKRIQEIARKNGYRRVRFFRAKAGDHYSVIMVKWLSVCPYSRFYCEWKYQLSKVYAILRTTLLSIQGKNKQVV